MRAHRGHVDADCGGDGVPHGGFYSQADIQEIVAYARQRFIQVVPEIEMPGHAHAAIASYAQYGALYPPSEVSTRWGVHQTLFNAEEQTFDFLEDVLDEVTNLFDC